MTPIDQTSQSADPANRGEPASVPDKAVVIMLDGEPLQLPSTRITPAEILVIAGLDPATNYLVLVQGRHQVSYQGRGDEQLHVHPHEAFVALSTGPTPTS